MIPKQGMEDVTRRAAVGTAVLENDSLPRDYRDVSNQEILKNHVLCAQFLRDYSNCKMLENVQPQHVLDIILDVVYLLCRKVNLSGDETHEMLSQLKEGRNMGYLFENMEHMDIQEERRKTREAREELERYRKKAEAELERVQREQAQLETRLEVALKELEQYRTVEKEKSET